MANRYANLVGSNKIKDEYQKINIGFDKVEQEMDAKADADELARLENTVNDHIGSGGSAHAEATDQQAGFMSAADKTKLDGIEPGAQVNQNAFAKVNDVVADDPSDTVTITGGTGITITTNPNTKEVTITATGESTPGPHGSSHTEHGADPIPAATTTEGGLMSADHVQMLESHASRHAVGGPDEITPGMIGAVSVDDFASQLAQIAINLKSYGAKGDGVTNDTAVLRQVSDLLKSAGSGKLLIPDGDYVIDSGFEFDFSNVVIEGEGRLMANDDSETFITVTGNNNIIKGIVFKEGPGKPNRLVDVTGDNNTLENCQFYYNEKLTTEEILWGNTNVRLLGNSNTVIHCESYNGGMGVSIANRNNKVLYSFIHDNIIGIRLAASSRGAEIAYNLIDNNNVNSASGADGILASRNVSRANIHHNQIYRSGEHGIYFQGDNSIISENVVSFNNHSGIKLASYTTDLYWHDDETPNPDYVGNNNIIANNICNENCLQSGSENDAGIYLQSPLKDILVLGNICDNQGHGIRSVIQNNGDVLEGIALKNNKCKGNTVMDCSIAGRRGISISSNEFGDLQVTAESTTRLNLSPHINNNRVDTLQAVRCDSALITNNEIKTLRDPVSSQNLTFKNNVITEQNENLILNRIYAFENNEVVLLNDSKLLSGIVRQIKSFCNNVIRVMDMSTAYVFNTSGVTNDLRFIGNQFIITVVEGTPAPSQRVVRLDGARLVVSNNTFIGSEPDILIDFYGSSSTITGNTSTTTNGTIGLRDGSSKNIVVGNAIKVSDTGVDNVVANNAV